MALTKKKGPVTTPKLPNIEALKKVNNITPVHFITTYSMQSTR